MSAESMQTLDDRVAVLDGVQSTLERLAAAERDWRALLPHRLTSCLPCCRPWPSGGGASEACFSRAREKVSRRRRDG